ncbi:MAG: hypothetical protein DMF90_23895 [Acidobacteria bacterium]|nr:MAG: hypothetical protein DMF90_23895 [Acidobacteriota bacterium]
MEVLEPRGICFRVVPDTRDKYMSVINRFAIVLASVAVMCTPTMVRHGVAAGQAGGSSQGSADRSKLVGTFELVVTEVKDAATGKWSPTPGFNSNGYIIYAATGHMGVHIMPKVRARFAANPPTGDEAQAALRGYAAYFGSFSVHDKERDRFVVHHRFGQINPGGFTSSLPRPTGPSASS